MNRHDLEKLIYDTVDIVPQGNDSVFLGLFSIVDNPACLDAITTYVARYYDTLLQTLPLTTSQRITMQMQRCCTYEEYKLLFVPTQNFNRFPFKTFLITSNSERLLFIRNRDSSYEAFVALLENWTKIHHPFLHAFIYEVHT